MEIQKTLYGLVLILILAGCSKDEEKEPSITGIEWLLIEVDDGAGFTNVEDERITWRFEGSTLLETQNGSVEPKNFAIRNDTLFIIEASDEYRSVIRSKSPDLIIEQFEYISSGKTEKIYQKLRFRK